MYSSSLVKIPIRSYNFGYSRTLIICILRLDRWLLIICFILENTCSGLDDMGGIKKISIAIFNNRGNRNRYLIRSYHLIASISSGS